MWNKWRGVIGLVCALVAMPGWGLTQDSEPVQRLLWQDLIPIEERGVVFDRPMANHDGDAPAQMMVGSVRQDLNGALVQIPGFVIPLEGDNTKVTEFLLVPFLGACIHVPPPPPNQIVYVNYQGGAPVNGLWDLVLITGRLTTEGVSSGLGETGYLLDGIAIEKYQER